MIRKNIIRLSFVFLTLFFTVGCQKDNSDNQLTGTLSFGKITRCDDTSDKDVNTKGAAPVFAVSVVDGDGKVHFSTADISSVEGRKISLPMGEYTVKAWTDNATAAAFDTKVYYGEKKVSIFNSVNSPVDIECKLDNVLADVVFSQNIKDNFTDYSLVVSNSDGELTFEGDDTRVGYFAYKDKLSYTVMLTDKLGDNYTYTGEVKDLNIRDFVHFNIDIKSRTDKDDLLFDLIINTSVNEKSSTFTVSLVPNDTPKPIVTLRGMNTDVPVVVGEGVGTDMFFDIVAEGGIRKIFVNFLSGAPASFPKYVEVLGSDASLLSSLGIATAVKGGEQNGMLDMTEFSRLIKAGEADMGTVVFSIGVYDDAYNLTKQNVTVNVVKAYLFTTAPVTTTDIDWSGERGTTEVTFGGSWAMNETPEGLTFQYREVGKTDWIIIDEQQIAIDEPNKSFSTTLDMYLARKYEVQAVSANDAGKVIPFATVRPAEPTNMSFDEWWLDGKTWFPYAQGGAKDWDSGNGGLTSAFAGKDPNTVPEYVKVVKGTAVKQVSVDAPAVGFAAGNLFTGYFKFDLGAAIGGNMTAMVHFGRPYAARPIQMKGYYSYTPVIINTGKAHDGEMDQCNIYIILEKWGSGVTERPKTPITIGKGDFRTSESNEEYKEFVVDITYESNEMPDHVIIVATSSIYGEQFIGGKGSTLYVDELELIY